MQRLDKFLSDSKVASRRELRQIIRAGRHRGVGFLRLSCGDAKLRRFFARLGFYPLGGDVMEKDIRQQLPPIPQAYRP